MCRSGNLRCALHQKLSVERVKPEFLVGIIYGMFPRGSKYPIIRYLGFGPGNRNYSPGFG